jgi:DNA-binding Xre family transcriptional regulator
VAIRNKVSMLLGARRVNIKQFSEEIGITYKSAHDIYWEKNAGMSYEVMEKLCEYFGVQPGDLFEYVPDHSQESITTGNGGDGSNETITKPKRGRPFKEPKEV